MRIAALHAERCLACGTLPCKRTAAVRSRTAAARGVVPAFTPHASASPPQLLLVLFGTATYKGVGVPLLAASMGSELFSAAYFLGKLQDMAGKGALPGRAGERQRQGMVCRGGAWDRVARQCAGARVSQGHLNLRGFQRNLFT
jgi:hypothetical protein